MGQCCFQASNTNNDQNENDSEIDNNDNTEIYVRPEFLQSDTKNNNSLNLQGPRRLNLKDFKTLNLLGKGSFGKVYLVEKTSNKKLYAMKVLKKDMIKNKNQILHTQAERQILENMKDHPYIVQLYCAFQSKSKLYMVMDFMQGGELFFHLRQAGKFTEIRAMFYCAQVVLALEHLHKNQIIYRDLKPENILVDKNGHIKIADFGLSKLGTHENLKTYTIAGTPEYLAPEIFMNQGHHFTADWWSLGAFLYEMLTGAPPFYSRNKEKMLQNILQKPIEMKSYFTNEAKDIISQLLIVDPTLRLGSKNDAEDIKNHAFFRQVDWEKLFEKKYEAPFKPKLNSDKDLRYIDKMFVHEAIDETLNAEDKLNNINSGKSSRRGTNQDFKGFTITIGTIHEKNEMHQN